MTMFSTVDGDEKFGVDDLAGIDAEHFYARTRQYLPLLPVVRRRVPSTTSTGAGRTTEVYDFPVNVILDRQLRSKSAMRLMEAYPSGEVLRGEEAAANGLGNDHIFSGPVLPHGNKRRTNTHANLARSSPFYGFDGLTGHFGRKMYVHDVAI